VPDRLATPIPLVHAGATWFMAGLIWFVQIVHYPLLEAVPADAFPAYERAHQQRTTWVVGPVMLLEASSAVLLLWLPRGKLTGTTLRWSGLALLALIWISTFALQVPLHAKLAMQFDGAVWHRLVVTNWLRTIAWTVRGVIALSIVWSIRSRWQPGHPLEGTRSRPHAQ
jgi:hypothetical protein